MIRPPMGTSMSVPHTHLIREGRIHCPVGNDNHPKKGLEIVPLSVEYGTNTNYGGNGQAGHEIVIPIVVIPDGIWPKEVVNDPDE